MDTTKSLISRENSTLLKGILIILIILGHNGILMGKSTGLTVTALNNYLYCFHVYLFLILPFLYNIPGFTFKRVKKDFLHLYKPYTLLIITILIANIFILKQPFEPLNTVYAYISGNEMLLNKTVGASFPWFLPVMFTLLILRNYFVPKKNYALLCVLLVSFTILLAVRVFNVISIYDFSFIIMGGMVAITYFSLAVTCRYIYERFSDKQYFNIISIIIFIKTSIIFFIQPILLPREIFLFLQWIILPISALYSLIVLVSKVKNICIKKF